MKKTTVITAIICMLISFTSCSTEPAESSGSETTASVTSVASVPQPVETTVAELELKVAEASQVLKPPTVKVCTNNEHGLEIGMYYCSPWGYEWAYPDEDGNMISELIDIADPLEHISMHNEVSTEEVDAVKVFISNNQPQPTVISVYKLNSGTNEFEKINYDGSFAIGSDGGEVYRLSITYLQGTADYYFRTVKPEQTSESEQDSAGLTQ